jgi:hypothetical protein
LSPNSNALWSALQRTPGTNGPDTEEILPPPEKLCVFSNTSLFLKVHTIDIHVKCNFANFGLLLETDPMPHRNLVVDVTSFSSASYLEWTTQLQFHIIIQIDKTPVLTVPEVKTKLALLADTFPESSQLLVAPYKTDTKDQHSPLP